MSDWIGEHESVWARFTCASPPEQLICSPDSHLLWKPALLLSLSPYQHTYQCTWEPCLPAKTNSGVNSTLRKWYGGLGVERDLGVNKNVDRTFPCYLFLTQPFYFILSHNWRNLRGTVKKLWKRGESRSRMIKIERNYHLTKPTPHINKESSMKWPLSKKTTNQRKENTPESVDHLWFAKDTCPYHQELRRRQKQSTKTAIRDGKKRGRSCCTMHTEP